MKNKLIYILYILIINYNIIYYDIKSVGISVPSLRYNFIILNYHKIMLS